MHIEDILKIVKQHSKQSEREAVWNLDSFEEFIISFEKNTQASNELLAKNYGNIIKNLVRDIMTKDSVIIYENREQEVLNDILVNNHLKEQFSKLYVLICKTNKQRDKHGKS